MAATTDLGEDRAFPPVAIRFAGELGAPLVVVEAAILTPDAAIEYARRSSPPPQRPASRLVSTLPGTPERAGPVTLRGSASPCRARSTPITSSTLFRRLLARQA
jgi:hypothetical protein